MNAVTPDNILRVCSEVLAPLIRQDRGELYLVELTEERVSLHLAGQCSGCPGTGFTTDAVIHPAIRAVAPDIQIVVTAGFRLPPGAKSLAAASASAPAFPPPSQH